MADEWRRRARLGRVVCLPCGCRWRNPVCHPSNFAYNLFYFRRLAIISDIHANFVALQAVLADIRRANVDSIICLGDVATMGAQPKQVIAELQRIGCPCILGNHESALLDPESAAHYHIAPQLVPSLHWAFDQLTKADLDYLRSFKPLFDISLAEETPMLLYHGSPTSNVGMIVALTPAHELDSMLAQHRAKIFVGGHTHVQMLRQYHGVLFVNVGSVGQPFGTLPKPGVPPSLLPWAEYAILDWANGALSVDLRRVPFDIAHYAREIKASEIPLRDWLLGEYKAA